MSGELSTHTDLQVAVIEVISLPARPFCGTAHITTREVHIPITLILFANIVLNDVAVVMIFWDVYSNFCGGLIPNELSDDCFINILRERLERLCDLTSLVGAYGHL
jgi:hypothetical protein